MFCLKTATDSSWATLAASDLNAVLADHAHCELKAAQNALSLAARHPENLRVVRALAAIAQEEAQHFSRVVSFLEKRGVALAWPAVDSYAADLRRITKGLAHSELGYLVDRLLMASLIEARSCERFKLLLEAPAVKAEAELHAFYMELFACEARHYRVFVELAIDAASGNASAVEARLELLALAEAKIAEGLVTKTQRAAMHG
ncbi:MAG: tRNA isopentenyl-2-thiomethyl-A-37 hydroxylase MiaE [Polyangiaceae bacterium]